MEKKKVFWVIAAFIVALFLAGCQKDEILPDQIQQEKGLFLKSSFPGERLASIWQIDGGQAGLFYFPNNILFLIEEGKARTLNQLFYVIDYHVFKDGEAIFRIVEPGAMPVGLEQTGNHESFAPYGEKVAALRLPFAIDDYGRQAVSGADRFNGLLKAGSYVLAIKNSMVSVFSLEKGLLDTNVRGEIRDDSFSFKIKSKAWTLTFQQPSPIGHIFSLSVDGLSLGCYTIN